MPIRMLFVSSCVTLAVLPCLRSVAAEEKPTAESAVSEAAEVSAEEIATLVKQLDSDKFAQRQAASERLAAIGKPAVEAVSEAAAGESLEVTVRAIDFLKGLLESSDEPAKEAAKAALERIAESDRPSAARRARDVLDGLRPRPTAQNVFPGGAFQIVLGAAAAGKRVSVRNVNGVKEIEVDEGDRQISIVDDPNQGIKMEITTKKNGKPVTEKYEAKDADELKKKHPQAHALYEQYSQQQAGMVVQMQIAGGAIPLRVAPMQRAAGAQGRNGVDMASRLLSAWEAHLKRLITDDAIDDASAESRQALVEKVSQMKERLEELENRLQEALEDSEEEEGKDASNE